MFKTFELACLAATATASTLVNMAQLKLQAADKTHTCTTTQDRNKAAVDPFYDLVLKTDKYSDPVFTPDHSSLDWVD